MKRLYILALTLLLALGVAVAQSSSPSSSSSPKRSKASTSTSPTDTATPTPSQNSDTSSNSANPNAGANSNGTPSSSPNPSTDAARIATNAGFLLGNAHRCGIPTDRVVKAGQMIRELIHAAAKDSREQEDATEQFATLFLATALPELGASKLVASCDNVTAEFQKFERHRVAGGASNKATGGTPSPRFRLSDGE